MIWAMIGNKHLQEFYNYNDEDASLNQILELLKYKNTDFIDSLKKPIDIKLCNSGEINYLVKTSAIIDYYLQLHDIEVPQWIRNHKLKFKKPYYHSKRISDIEKIKLIYTNPAPFRARNVYFDLNGLERV